MRAVTSKIFRVGGGSGSGALTLALAMTLALSSAVAASTTAAAAATSASFTTTAAAAAAATIVIDTSAAGLGPRYDSFGAISGGGATSRLLFQYDNATVSHILDLLFLPKFGASLHHLKVEVGGDGQSSEGVEPSHLHADDASAANFERGYEWRLMREARARNPAILLSALAWTWPGWVGAGSHSPWTDTNKSVTYLLSWLRGAREVHGLELDYINADWNERGYSPAFVKALRAALNAQGFPLLKIVCGDDSHTYSCASAAAADPELRAAVAAFGSHGPQGPDPNVGSIPVWNTEIHAFEAGGTALAQMLPMGFITQNITGGTSWNMLGAYNPGLFAPDSGIFRAWWPWCGYYEQLGQLWVWAHFMQATRPGMRFLRVGSGSGQAAGGAVFLTFYDEATRDVTLVVYAGAAASGQAAFQLSGPGAAGIRALHAVRSLVVANAHPAPDVSQYFVLQPDVAVAADGSFGVPLAPGVLWTLTTVPGMTKGVAPQPPAATPFPATFEDGFDDCALEQEADFWTDMTGSFQCVAAAPPRSGVVMRQAVPMHPVAWRPEEQRPFSLFAADISWAATSITIDVLMAAGEGALVGVRANPNCCGRVITGEDLMPGVWLGVQAGSSSFSVWNAIANVTSATTGVLLKGTIAPAPTAGSWVQLQLNVTAGGVVSAAVDGQQLFGGLNVQGKVADAGFASIGTFDWGQYVSFDNFAVSGNA